MASMRREYGGPKAENGVGQTIGNGYWVYPFPAE